jgi:hypothetical protein
MKRAIVVVIVGFVGTAHAQGAWVGAPKSLDTDFSYQYVPSSAVVIDTSNKAPLVDEIPDRPTRNHVFAIGAEYVPLEKLAVEAHLPLALVKYTGTIPHSPPGAWDGCEPGQPCKGSTHTTLTDLRIGARYQVLDEPYVAISPHLAVSIPLMNYEVNGFATGGRHLKQLHVGASFGRSLAPYLPSLVLSASYELSIGEKYDRTPETAKIGQTHSDVDAQIAYFLLDGKLGLSVGANWRIPHSGIAFDDFVELGAKSPDLVNFHDPLLREGFLFLGGGVSYEINDKLTVAVLTRLFVRGENTRDQDLFGIDLTWNVM